MAWGTTQAEELTVKQWEAVQKAKAKADLLRLKKQLEDAQGTVERCKDEGISWVFRYRERWNSTYDQAQRKVEQYKKLMDKARRMIEYYGRLAANLPSATRDLAYWKKRHLDAQQMVEKYKRKMDKARAWIEYCKRLPSILPSATQKLAYWKARWAAARQLYLVTYNYYRKLKLMGE